jgi:PAS domain S-box-containing protein
MPANAPAPIDPPSPTRVYASGMAWRAAVASAGIAVLIALVVDRYHERALMTSERARVRAVMAPYATAMQDAVQRRVAMLIGLRSFVDSRRTRRELDEEFPLYAAGMLTAASGIRALQLVDQGRITHTWPVAGNEEAAGYDLLGDPRPAVGGDVRRALESGAITVTGPIALVQGGEGLLVRQAVTQRAGFPQLAAVIVDMPAIVGEAGLPARGSGLRLEARDRNHAWFGGDAFGSAVAPETLTVRVPDGDWTLLGSPEHGWAAAVSADLSSGRLTAIALVIVAGLLGLVLGGREARLAREVTESGTRLDLALRAGQLGAWEFDILGGHVVWSEAAAAIFGYAAGELTGDSDQLFDRVHPEDRRGLRRLIGEMLSGSRRDYVTEFRVELPDGATRWVLGIGELERDAAGRPVRMLGVVSDASERREIEERLRHSQRLEAVGTLAGGVAHDFNNLLTAIIGFTELAMDRASRLETEDGRAIRGDLAQVLMTAERAASLTGQLLAFSRRKATEPSRIDVTAALTELEPMLRRLLGDGNELRTELTPGLPAVWIDAGQLTQVMLNLVVNARDAMPSHGVVRIRTLGVRSAGSTRPLDAPAGEWVCIEVGDSGVGMSAELQARIFEPYFTTKEVGRGTGLGLAVVYGAVENAGGRVTVESVEGRGTVFRIYLPPRRATDELSAPLGALSPSA